MSVVLCLEVVDILDLTALLINSKQTITARIPRRAQGTHILITFTLRLNSHLLILTHVDVREVTVACQLVLLDLRILNVGFLNDMIVPRHSIGPNAHRLSLRGPGCSGPLIDFLLLVPVEGGGWPRSEG